MHFETPSIRRRARIAIGVIAATVCAQVVLAPLRFPRTDSLPRGLYWLTERAVDDESIFPGDLVLVCLPEAAARLGRARRYLRSGSCPGAAEPVGKRVVAVAGDRVLVEVSGVRVNGRLLVDSRVRSVDSGGRPLDHLAGGSFLLGEGQLWLFSSHPLSWDSRYYGPVDERQVRGCLLLLWTWPKSLPVGRLELR